MPRADEGLAFLLKYENVAWYENGTVRILDRRCYPHPVSFVTCRTSAEVAQAITDMVTQSAGPYLAAGMGMVLAAHEGAGGCVAEQSTTTDFPTVDKKLITRLNSDSIFAGTVCTSSKTIMLSVRE